MTQKDQNPISEETLETPLPETSLDDWATQSSPDDELTRLSEALARSQADYQNLVMRSERDKADMLAYLSSKIITPLLKEVDNLDRAVALKAWVEGDTFIDGIRTIQSSIVRYLESQWVTSFVSLGQEVDPSRHDVMTQMPGEEWKIIQEFEKGYLIGDRVLRHAKVVAGSGL